MAFDYEKLTPEQNKIALKVLKSAEKYGLNPEFVIPLVLSESSLSHIPSKSVNESTSNPTAFGVMQLTPDTAKQYGLKDYMSKDVDANIDAGMRFLQDLTKNEKIGGDPKKVIAGYNAGPASKFVQTGNEKDLEPETRKHIENITKNSLSDSLSPPILSSNGNDELTPEEIAEHNRLAGENAKPFGSEGSDDSGLTEEEKKEHDLLAGPGAKPFPAPPEPIAEATGEQGALAGEIAGATLSGARNIASIYQDVQENRANKKLVEELAKKVHFVDPTSVQGRAEAMFESPTGPRDAGRMARGETGAQTYNAAKAAGLTDIEAGRALDMTKNEGGVYDLLTQRREGLNNTKNSGYVENPLFGGLMTNDTSVGNGPRKKFVSTPTGLQEVPLPEKIPNTPAPVHEPVNTTPSAQKTSLTNKALNTAGNVVRGGFAGFNAGVQGQELMNAIKRGDYGQAAMHLLSSGASVADILSSVIPVVKSTAVRAAAAPLSMAASTGANVVKHAGQNDYMGAAADIGQGAVTGGLSMIPYVGLPAAIAADYGISKYRNSKDAQHLKEALAKEAPAYDFSQSMMGP